MRSDRSGRQVGLGVLLTVVLASVGCGSVTRVAVDAKADSRPDGSVGSDTPADLADDVTQDVAQEGAADQPVDRPPEARPDVAADRAGDAPVDRPADLSADRAPDAPTDARPDGLCSCPAVEMPVCGVDGRTYGNSCQAMCAGVAIAHAGACADAGIDPICLTPASCTFYPTLGPGCCGACRAKGEAAPPQINCLIACRDPHTGCVCMNGNCTPTGGGGGMASSRSAP